MVIHPKYIKKVSNSRYILNTDNVIRPKNKDKAQAKGQVKMALDYRALNKT